MAESLFEEWVARAEAITDKNANAKYWNDYYEAEKHAYEKILGDKTDVLEGDVKSIGETLGLDEVWMIGFLDGISESLKEDLPDIETIDASTELKIQIDFEKLLWNMHKAEAPWLYEIPAWDGIFSQEKQEAIATEYKHSKTIRKGAKVGRNDPCPCGSGKKYKKCCGRNA